MESIARTADPILFKDAVRAVGPCCRRLEPARAGDSRWLREATDAMLELAGVTVGQRAGLAPAPATRHWTSRSVSAPGQVLATDLSPVILDLAADNARCAGLTNVQTQVADAESLPLEAAASTPPSTGSA